MAVSPQARFPWAFVLILVTVLEAVNFDNEDDPGSTTAP
jgi:hypothetical protein